MADVKQCDRCGACYKEGGHHFVKTNGVWVEHKYDLCNDCFKELSEFMRGVKPRNLLERIWQMFYAEEN